MVQPTGPESLGTVVSVNVGEPRTVEWAGRQVLTAIWKTPTAGRVAVAGINFAGDRQADLRVHGGPDKAVYVYAIEDYRWWTETLGTPVTPATFGENLTVEGVDLATAIVGDVWTIGTARFQVSQPRLPCFKLGIRMNDAGFVDRFDDAARYGIYLRILDAGEIGAGDAIGLESRPAHRLTPYAIAGAQRAPEPELLRQIAAVDGVPTGWQEWATRQLGRAERKGHSS